MKDNLLIDLSKQFAIDIVLLCNKLREKDRENVIINQLLKSGTSVGANIHEANYAASRADFINKFQIALKECYESDYWLEIFKETKIIDEETYKNFHNNCSKIRKILSTSIKTAKQNI